MAIDLQQQRRQVIAGREVRDIPYSLEPRYANPEFFGGTAESMESAGSRGGARKSRAEFALPGDCQGADQARRSA